MLNRANSIAKPHLSRILYWGVRRGYSWARRPLVGITIRRTYFPRSDSIVEPITLRFVFPRHLVILRLEIEPATVIDPLTELVFSLLVWIDTTGLAYLTFRMQAIWLATRLVRVIPASGTAARYPNAASIVVFPLPKTRGRHVLISDTFDELDWSFDTEDVEIGSIEVELSDFVTWIFAC